MADEGTGERPGPGQPRPGETQPIPPHPGQPPGWYGQPAGAQAPGSYPPAGQGQQSPGSYPPSGYGQQPPPGSYPQGGYGQQPPPGWYGQPYAPRQETSSNAIVALVAAILAWVFCPIIPAIVALIFASKADQEIAASGGYKTGRELVTAAKIIAWVNLAIGLLLVFGAFLLLGFAIPLGGPGTVSA